MIYGIVIVPPGEADRYLGLVLSHALRWVDQLHVALEPEVTDHDIEVSLEWASSYSKLRCSASANDGMAKTDAWLDMAHSFTPTEDDCIAVIKPTEVFLDPKSIQQAVKAFPGSALQAKIYHLWDSDHVRVDGDWQPRLETVIVPWRRGGSYPDYRLRAGRLPTYHFTVPMRGIPMSDVLDYDMLSFKDKLRKWEWFERVGAQDFYSYDHINSIRRTPMLRTWKKGGIFVGEPD